MKMKRSYVTNLMNNDMSKQEREELLKLVKARARVAKAGIEQHQAALIADLEKQLAAKYKPEDDPVWKAAHEAAEAAVREADARIAEECERLGIPPEFRPGISVYWYARGKNAAKERRAEIRKLAQARLEAEARKLKVAIDTWAVDAQTELVAGSLESGEAKRFLDSQEVGFPLVQQPAYAPELDPVERLFEELRRVVEGKVYDAMAAKVAAIEAELREWDADPDRVRRLVSWPWIMDTLNQLPRPKTSVA
jgi:hypothetical protein